MLRATELRHLYAGVPALDGVSFEARAGEVLGFLGPNGAGKTTAMRICAGFLRPSGGRVEVCGHDVTSAPLAARAQLGYLPESVPLYPEMRVDEYLAYRAALKGVARRATRARVDQALAEVGIGDARRRVIGQLSKGYRQRVGLADALVHQPPVLILDEPTDGLDPNQRREVLDLIAALGRERAVVLSTHILPEVESVCSRVVVLDRGRVIAAGRPGELAEGERRLRVVARGARAAIVAAARGCPGVTAVDVIAAGNSPEANSPGTHTANSPAANSPGTHTANSPAANSPGTHTANSPAASSPGDGDGDDGEVTLEVRANRDVREDLAAAVTAVARLRELRPAALQLEAVFAALTGRGG